MDLRPKREDRNFIIRTNSLKSLNGLGSNKKMPVKRKSSPVILKVEKGTEGLILKPKTPRLRITLKKVIDVDDLECISPESPDLVMEKNLGLT